MASHEKILSLLLAIFSLGAAHGVEPEPQPHVQARLLSEAKAAQPGASFWMAVELKMDPGWHTYWKNSGDSGLATKIQWDLPPGFSAGPIQWPTPVQFGEPSVLNYGYQDTILLLTQIHAPARIAAETAPLKARVKWLECADICLPGNARLHLELPVSPDGGKQNAEIFARARATLPAKDAGWKISAMRDRKKIKIALAPPPGFAGTLAEAVFYPDTSDQIDIQAPQKFYRSADGYALELNPAAPSGATALEGVLVSKEGWNAEKSKGLEVRLKIR